MRRPQAKGIQNEWGRRKGMGVGVVGFGAVLQAKGIQNEWG